MQVNLKGNLSKAPQFIHSIKTNEIFVTFDIAVDEYFEADDSHSNIEAKTHWINVVGFDPSMMNAIKTLDLNRGDFIEVWGEFRQRQYTHQGEERTQDQIVLQGALAKVKVLSRRSEQKLEEKTV